MYSLELLMARNRSWSMGQRQNEPNYFSQFVNKQAPYAFWIGCSDSRVPVESIVQAHPGELFVYRNMANIVHEDDSNFMSALQYALEHLKVSSIIVCGHQGCGGIKYAYEEAKKSIIEDTNIAKNEEQDYIKKHLKKTSEDIYKRLDQTLKNSINEEDHNIFSMRNVLNQIETLKSLPLIKDRFEKNSHFSLYGCFYNLGSGQIKILDSDSFSEEIP